MTISLRNRALRLLAMRDYSVAQLRERLAKYIDSALPEELEEIITSLQQLGLQSDQRFAEIFISARRQRYGDTKIRHELRQRGIAEAIIESLLTGGDVEDDQFERAQNLWQKKFGTPAENAQQWAQQARYLQSRGFPAQLIHKLLKNSNNEYS